MTQSFDFCINDIHPIAGSVEVDTDFDTGTPLAVNKFVGNITTGWNGDINVNGLNFSDYWDQVTPENAGKWGSVEQAARGPRNWGTLDGIYAYTEANGIQFKQHAFVWGNQAPENSGILQESDVKSWMTEFCTRYPNTQLIDVVNEPPPHTEPEYAANIGGGTNGDWAWIVNAFTWAREACPNAILILNDYNNIEWSNDNQHFIDIAVAVRDAGAPIDAVGAQAHDLDHSGVSADTVKSLLAKLHNDTGLPVYISELDISTKNDGKQLDLYKTYIPWLLETEYVHGITVWGWIVGQTWSQAADSGLVDGTTPRPAMTWLMNSLGRPALN
ncbi:MAG: endo-1,4-beta-xylanase [Deltaproteobacteria bacterium]|nr:endo-1,4-beta-xylanase [Deltaproteobacteria bacterium]